MQRHVRLTANVRAIGAAQGGAIARTYLNGGESAYVGTGGGDTSHIAVTSGATNYVRRLITGLSVGSGSDTRPNNTALPPRIYR